MTDRAVVIEHSRDVIRLCHVLVFRLLAGPAVQRHIGVSIIHVAIDALLRGVCSRERKSRCIVIEQ